MGPHPHPMDSCSLNLALQTSMSPLQQLTQRATTPSLTGDLFLYAQGRVAFETPSGSSSSTNKCILLGGLSDGLMPVPYVSPLASMLAEENWTLVQPILSSSYTGFGHGSLDRDVEEINELLEHLVNERDCRQVAMVGHSTGTQDIVHYLKYGREDLVRTISVVALQAPVSDRESATVCQDENNNQETHMANLLAHIQTATEMRETNHGDEMMPRSAFWAPITANRFLDLNERGGRDDYFSADYSDDELSSRLRHIGSSTSLRSCLVAVSGSDEYVPTTVDSRHLLGRLCRAMDENNSDRPKAIPLYLPTGNHNLSSRQRADSIQFLAEFRRLLPSRS